MAVGKAFNGLAYCILCIKNYVYCLKRSRVSVATTSSEIVEKNKISIANRPLSLNSMKNDSLVKDLVCIARVHDIPGENMQSTCTAG